MAKGYPRGLARGRPNTQEIIRQVVPVRDMQVTVAGLTGVGFGTAVIGDVPEGNLLFLGAVSYLQFTGPGSANLQDNFDGDYAIGTAPTADATLAGAEVDIIASTALGAATAEVSPRARGTHAVAITGTVLDNTDNSLELNLNLLIDDASIDANGIVMRANGEVILTYIVLGDD